MTDRINRGTISEYSNSEIRRAFKNATSPGSNESGSMQLVELPDDTLALLDYNWAKIAERSPNGQITVFAGWANWAQHRFEQANDHGGEATTHRHVRELMEYLLDCGRNFTVSKARPEVMGAPSKLGELGYLNMIPSRGQTDEGRTE